MRVLRMLHDYHRRIRRGHRWAWRNDFEPGTFDGLPAGSVVRLESREGEFLGLGFANGASHVAVRVMTERDEPVDGALIRERVRQAVAWRQVVRRGDETFRAVYGESDGLPGLAADRYGPVLVLSQSVAGMEPWTDALAAALDEALHPETILLKNTNRLRVLEGLPLEKRLLKGAWDGPVEAVYDGARVLVDCLGGRKTGLFLDHRENRRLLAGLVRGGETVLDLFSHCGLWAFGALARGAARAVCVDADAAAVELGAASARLNGWADRAAFVQADTLAFLEGETRAFDIVVLDPPAFVKKKRFLRDGLELYALANAAALRRVAPGGLFVTSSCSSFVDGDALARAVDEAAADQGLRLQLVATGTQALDHPVLAPMPETRYLKCLFYRRVR
ncbi:MAG: class I SAM-dependent rRNA methyltransferase [Acidobacteria bacterium]|nr:class I SAM-dependent rRNA methyltransferase [Acidobacteriota bacterium]